MCIFEVHSFLLASQPNPLRSSFRPIHVCFLGRSTWRLVKTAVMCRREDVSPLSIHRAEELPHVGCPPQPTKHTHCYFQWLLCLPPDGDMRKFPDCYVHVRIARLLRLLEDGNVYELCFVAYCEWLIVDIKRNFMTNLREGLSPKAGDCVFRRPLISVLVSKHTNCTAIVAISIAVRLSSWEVTLLWRCWRGRKWQTARLQSAVCHP